MFKSLNKKTQAQVLRLFKNETKDARKIGQTLRIPRFSIMEFLEEKGLRSYSPGSYNL